MVHRMWAFSGRSLMAVSMEIVMRSWSDRVLGFGFVVGACFEGSLSSTFSATNFAMLPVDFTIFVRSASALVISVSCLRVVGI